MGRRPAGITYVLTAAAVTVAACGASSSSGRTEEGGAVAASCAASLAWKGQSYVGVSNAHGLPATGAVLSAKAVDPPCNDTDGSDAQARRVTVRRIGDVDPALALRTSPDDPTIYLVQGVFTSLPGHPLHRAFYRSASQPHRSGDGRRCSVAGRVDGRWPDGFGVVAAGRGSASVTVDAGTRIVGGARRAGQPFLAQGAVVRVSARRCLTVGRARRVTAVRVVVG